MSHANYFFLCDFVAVELSRTVFKHENWGRVDGIFQASDGMDLIIVAIGTASYCYIVQLLVRFYTCTIHYNIR